jgi:tRNA-splicing ligase RtcB
MNANHLIKAGYQPGPQIDQMLTHVASLEARGVSGRSYLLKLLDREFGPPPPRFIMREKPLQCTEALKANTKEEKENREKVRKTMAGMLKCPVVEQGTIMPDACPTGPQAVPVGGAIAARNAIIPEAHSADICCSMFATFYKARTDVSEELDALITATRFGMGGRHFDDRVHHPVLDEEVWENPFLKGLFDRARIHIADQGDGNHFAFIGEIEVTAELASRLRKSGYLHFGDFRGKVRALVTHHGSRSLGMHVYKKGLNAAIKHTAKVGNHVPDSAAWLDANSQEGKDYWDALQYLSRWTRANHESIHTRFLERIQSEAITSFGNEHNFVWKRGDLFYHGKGATPAWKDKGGRPLLGLIPLNMAEPILIVLGKNNENYLSFAPHGAGRNLSRTALRKQHRSADHRKNLIDHHTRSIDVRWFVGEPDFTETPIAYKNADEIKKQIKEFQLADIIGEILPLGCIMAGQSKLFPWKRDEEELTPKQKRQIQHRAERRRVKQGLRGNG